MSAAAAQEAAARAQIEYYFSYANYSRDEYLRSLGATPSMVVWQVLKETVLLTFVAGVCGLVASVGVVELLDYLLGEGISGSFKHPEVSLELVLLCLAAMVVVGLIAGLLPALRAVAIQPVEALRSGT